MLKTFSAAVNFIEKWSLNRFLCFTLQVMLNACPDSDFPVSCHVEIINKYEYLQSRPGGRKVYSPADMKFFPRRNTRARNSYMANLGILLSYNVSMKYHTA